MTKDPKSVERKGTPARKSEPASKVQAREQVKELVKEQVKEHANVAEIAAALTAATMLTLPLLVVPSLAAAQSTGWPPISPTAPMETTKAAGQEGTLIIRMEKTVTVLGIGGGHTVFKDVEGATFYIDPATGDKRSVAADYFVTRDDIAGDRSAGRLKFTNVMIVSILGADAQGNTVMRNARNETFTLDPKTGSKVLIKWPK